MLRCFFFNLMVGNHFITYFEDLNKNNMNIAKINEYTLKPINNIQTILVYLCVKLSIIQKIENIIKYFIQNIFMGFTYFFTTYFQKYNSYINRQYILFFKEIC